MKHLRALVLGLVLVTTSGCSTLASSALGAILPTNDGVAVDAELTVGDKQEDINTDLQQGDRIAGENVRVEKTEINEASPLILGLLILGWCLPTPLGIWKGIRKLFKGRFDS